MRITNSIMQNNTLYNINNNKVAEDKLSSQMSTGKKVSKPSDDPVVAIRALRLHTNVTEVKQYYTYNSSDAESWMKTTQDAMSNLTDIINNLYEQVGKGAKKGMQSSDLKVIQEEMDSLVQEYYSIGNTDYAGRFIFTGYRTDTPLTFQEQTQAQFNINEDFTKDSIDEIKYTGLHDLDKITSENFMKYDRDDLEGKKDSIVETTLHRIRLAYDNLEYDKNDPDSQKKRPKLTLGGQEWKEGSTITWTEQVDDGTGKMVDQIKTATITRSTVSINAAGKDAAYAPLGDNEIRFIPETGELLLGDHVYKAMMESDDTLRVNYDKSQWAKGDLNPEHYFSCTKTVPNGNPATITYNTGKNGENTVADQKIEYDIGYNQKVQVNTNAYECFDPNMQQDMNDLRDAIDQLENIENTVANLEKYRTKYEESTDEYKMLTRQIAAAEKAYGYIRDDVQRRFEHAVTRKQGYLDKADLAITSSGTRSARLDLAKNRLMEQKTTYESLQSENEDSDATEVTIQLKSVQLSYEAALLATSKILQTTLLNYL